MSDWQPGPSLTAHGFVERLAEGEGFSLSSALSSPRKVAIILPVRVGDLYRAVESSEEGFGHQLASLVSPGVERFLRRHAADGMVLDARRPATVQRADATDAGAFECLLLVQWRGTLLRRMPAAT